MIDKSLPCVKGRICQWHIRFHNVTLNSGTRSVTGGLFVHQPAGLKPASLVTIPPPRFTRHHPLHKGGFGECQTKKAPLCKGGWHLRKQMTGGLYVHQPAELKPAEAWAGTYASTTWTVTVPLTS